MDKEAAYRRRGQYAAQMKWAHCDDRVAATEAARAGLETKFEREVDPDGTLSPQERFKRVQSRRKAHMLKMTTASLKARRKSGAIR